AARHPISVAERSVGDLDLLRALGLDPGAFATTRLDPAANPNVSASQTPQIKTRRRETALVSFQDGNRNVADPPPAEIYVDCAPTFAHGRHFALDQRKSASVRQCVVRRLGVKHLIIRIGPYAKFGLADSLLALQESPGARTCDAVADPGVAIGHEFLLQQELVTLPEYIGVGEQATVAIRTTLRPPQHDLVADGKGAKRRRGS